MRRPALGNPVATDREATVGVVTIDRPAVRNAVDGPTAAALDEAVRHLDADPDVSAIVLTGAGGTFCAGADLKTWAEEDRALVNDLDHDHRGPMGPTRRRTSKPVIAAIEGHAVAGGLELALWADLRVVASDAILGVFCRRWGVPLIDGGTVRLARMIGQSRALDLVLTGRPVHADEAERIGLANRVCAPGEARATAVALGRELAAFPQTTLQSDREGVLSAFDLPLDQALVVEHARGLAAIAAGGMQEGVREFVAGAGRGGTFAPLDAGRAAGDVGRPFGQ